MNDWSKDINLEAIKEYLQECAENDDYHYEQYQVDIVMHEYIRQKQVIEAITNENDKLHSIIKEVREYIEEHKHLNWYNDSCYMNDLLEILDKENNVRITD